MRTSVCNYKTSLGEKSNPVPASTHFRPIQAYHSTVVVVVLCVVVSPSILIIAFRANLCPEHRITCAVNDIYVLLMNFTFSRRIARRSVIDHSWLTINLLPSVDCWMSVVMPSPSTIATKRDLSCSSSNWYVVFQDSVKWQGKIRINYDKMERQE